MQIKLTYDELQAYAAKRFGRQIALGYVNETTVNASVRVSVFGFSKFVSVDFKVEGIKGPLLSLSYSGGLGIELVIGPALSFMKRLMPEKTGFIRESRGNGVDIDLCGMEQTARMLEYVEIKDISFNENGVIVDAGLK